MPRRVPQVRLVPKAIVMAGGLDLVSPTAMSAPGTLRYSNNYEEAVGGGYRRIGGIERFDGRAAPSDADYVLLTLSAAPANVVVGDTVTGDSSAATGEVFYISGNTLAVTRVTGAFVVEDLMNGVALVGDIVDENTAVDGFLDNDLQEAAANVYRLDITKVPGSGRVRGVAILNDTVYAWRNNALGTAMAIHKSTVGGWVEVALEHEIDFTLGTAEYVDGDTLTQGPATSTIRRVILLSGTWGAGTAAGKMVISAPSGGVFAAGLAAGTGACTLSGASSLMTLAPNGVVSTKVHNFFGGVTTRRLYGCDGVNREFEFDGTVWAPISTGMTIRASRVNVHKNQLFFSFVGSLQHSAPGSPFVWSPIFGAAELGVGDEITDLVSVGGSEVSAAQMVMTRDTCSILYGNDSSDWQLSPLSDTVGGARGSAIDIGGVVALDRAGFAKYPATTAFGNFLSRSVSMRVTPLVSGKDCSCSVFSPLRNVYRVFFTDGTAVSGFPGSKEFDWLSIDYDRTILHAVNGEINGDSRTFYGDDQGWVYEADVGRSFDGAEVDHSFITTHAHMGNHMVRNQFRFAQLEVEADSAFRFSIGCEFLDGSEGLRDAQTFNGSAYGAGLVYGMENWGESYWGVGGRQQLRVPTEGQGVSIAMAVAGRSATELPHTIKLATIVHTPLRLVRAA